MKPEHQEYYDLLSEREEKISSVIGERSDLSERVGTGVVQEGQSIGKTLQIARLRKDIIPQNIAMHQERLDHVRDEMRLFDEGHVMRAMDFLSSVSSYEDQLSQVRSYVEEGVLMQSTLDAHEAELTEYKSVLEEDIDLQKSVHLIGRIEGDGEDELEADVFAEENNEEEMNPEEENLPEDEDSEAIARQERYRKSHLLYDVVLPRGETIQVKGEMSSVIYGSLASSSLEGAVSVSSLAFLLYGEDTPNNRQRVYRHLDRIRKQFVEEHGYEVKTVQLEEEAGYYLAYAEAENEIVRVDEDQSDDNFLHGAAGEVALDADMLTREGRLYKKQVVEVDEDRVVSVSGAVEAKILMYLLSDQDRDMERICTSLYGEVGNNQMQLVRLHIKRLSRDIQQQDPDLCEQIDFDSISRAVAADSVHQDETAVDAIAAVEDEVSDAVTEDEHAIVQLFPERGAIRGPHDLEYEVRAMFGRVLEGVPESLIAEMIEMVGNNPDLTREEFRALSQSIIDFETGAQVVPDVLDFLTPQGNKVSDSTKMNLVTTALQGIVATTILSEGRMQERTMGLKQRIGREINAQMFNLNPALTKEDSAIVLEAIENLSTVERTLLYRSMSASKKYQLGMPDLYECSAEDMCLYMRTELYGCVRKMENRENNKDARDLIEIIEACNERDGQGDFRSKQIAANLLSINWGEWAIREAFPKIIEADCVDVFRVFLESHPNTAGLAQELHELYYGGDYDFYRFDD